MVATPIGNLDDISRRAIRVLSGVDHVLAEDTRHTRQLLNRLGVKARLHALHDHNEEQKVPAWLEVLSSGSDLALVSDAGTPLVSDPGFRLVRGAREAGLRVSPLPGPSSPVAALSVCGLATDRFIFEGFLPHKAAARRAHLSELGRDTRTTVLLESSHRIRDAVADIVAVLGGDRGLVLAKELTKVHEAVVGENAASVLAWLEADRARLKGEFVLVLEGAPNAPTVSLDSEALIDALLGELPASKLARVLSRVTGIDRKEAYQRVLERSK
ncbi:MAG: 16S rRNA (cytidine(1402)-2'-O)-methyltransferase [Gammaproteobacteria bacterium]